MDCHQALADRQLNTFCVMQGRGVNVFFLKASPHRSERGERLQECVLELVEGDGGKRRS